MSKHNQVAKKEEEGGAVATTNDIPEYMRGKEGAGTENIGITDMEVPRIKLMNAISPEVTAYTDVKVGDFWHTLAEQSLGKDIRIVPVYIDKRYILWRPRKSGGGILARADDGIHWNPPNAEFQVTLPETKKTVVWKTKPTVAESGLTDWGSYDPADSTSQPAATEMFTFVVALPDFPELGFAQLTLQRGSVSVAKNLLGKIRIHKAPSYGRIFRMSSVEEKNGAGESFMNFKFTADGYVPADDFNAYEALYEQFKSMGLNIKDIDDLQEGVASAPAPEGKPNTKNF